MKTSYIALLVSNTSYEQFNLLLVLWYLHTYEPVIVKWTPQNWFPPELIFLVNKDPLKHIYCKIWTPSEKFRPPPTDKKNGRA